MNNTEDKTRSNVDDVKCIEEEEVEEWNDEKKKHYKKRADFSMGTFIFI
jgi:hypothetical protein